MIEVLPRNHFHTYGQNTELGPLEDEELLARSLLFGWLGLLLPSNESGPMVIPCSLQ